MKLFQKGADMEKTIALLKKITPFLMAILFFVAIRILYVEMRGISFSELREAFSQISWPYALLSVLSVFCSYGLLTINEYVGVTQGAKVEIPYGRVARTSFISNAIGFNVGAAFLSGGSIRYNLYSALGLKAAQIGYVIAFAQMSAALGTFALNGAIFLFWPAEIFTQTGTLLLLRHVAGVFFFCIPAVVFLCSFQANRGRTYSVFGRKVPIPEPRILIQQLAVGFARPFFTALILFALLPHAQINYFVFCGAFVLSALAGNLSMIPGGLGVFDASLLWMLTPFYDPAELVGAVLLYRLLYFIVPFVLALFLLLVVKGRTKYLERETKGRT